MIRYKDKYNRKKRRCGIYKIKSKIIIFKTKSLF